MTVKRTASSNTQVMPACYVNSRLLASNEEQEK